MIASYKDIFSLFLNKVEDYKAFPNLTEELFFEIATNYLHDSCSEPKIRKLFDHITFDDILLEFDFELKNSIDENSDLDFIKKLLSTAMVIEWLNPQLNSTLNIQQMYGGKEEKFYAQSNHLNSIVNLHSYWTSKLHRLISNRNTDNNSYLNEGK